MIMVNFDEYFCYKLIPRCGGHTNNCENLKLNDAIGLLFIGVLNLIYFFQYHSSALGTASSCFQYATVTTSPSNVFSSRLSTPLVGLNVRSVTPTVYVSGRGGV